MFQRKAASLFVLALIAGTGACGEKKFASLSLTQEPTTEADKKPDGDKGKVGGSDQGAKDTPVKPQTGYVAPGDVRKVGEGPVIDQDKAAAKLEQDKAAAKQLELKQAGVNPACFGLAAGSAAPAATPGAPVVGWGAGAPPPAAAPAAGSTIPANSKECIHPDLLAKILREETYAFCTKVPGKEEFAKCVALSELIATERPGLDVNNGAAFALCASKAGGAAQGTDVCGPVGCCFKLK